MSKRLNRKFGISRRINASLWGSNKDPYNKKNYPPGAHGPSGYKKATEYGTQLLAKQKLKKYYGDIREKQFKSIYKESMKKKGDTGKNLIGFLESRLDAFIYRSKFAPTIFASRQLVSHKHVKVNGIVVNIPSYRLKPSDTIELKSSAENMKLALESSKEKSREIPNYIKVENKKFCATFIKIPILEEIPFPVQMEPSLVVEFYSR